MYCRACSPGLEHNALELRAECCRRKNSGAGDSGSDRQMGALVREILLHVNIRTAIQQPGRLGYSLILREDGFMRSQRRPLRFGGLLAL